MPTTVGFTVVLQSDLGKVRRFGEINELWYQKLSNFRRLVLDAQEELEAHLWVCFRSRMIFEKNKVRKKNPKKDRLFSPNDASGKWSKCKLGEKTEKNRKNHVFCSKSMEKI